MNVVGGAVKSIVHGHLKWSQKMHRISGVVSYTFAVSALISGLWTGWGSRVLGFNGQIGYSVSIALIAALAVAPAVANLIGWRSKTM
jgi:hypothetical protein